MIVCSGCLLYTSVKVQLPGVKKDDIDVELDNDFMTITAEIREEQEEKAEKAVSYTHLTAGHDGIYGR